MTKKPTKPTKRVAPPKTPKPIQSRYAGHRAVTVVPVLLAMRSGMTTRQQDDALSAIFDNTFYDANGKPAVVDYARMDIRFDLMVVPSEQLQPLADVELAIHHVEDLAIDVHNAIRDAQQIFAAIIDEDTNQPCATVTPGYETRVHHPSDANGREWGVWKRTKHGAELLLVVNDHHPAALGFVTLYNEMLDTPQAASGYHYRYEMATPFNGSRMALNPIKAMEIMIDLVLIKKSTSFTLKRSLFEGDDRLRSVTLIDI